MLRIVLIFFTQVLLWMLLSEANHGLSGWHIYLFAGGLFVTFPALVLPLRSGLAVSFLGGLFCDASMPISLDAPRLALSLAHTHALLFVCAHVIVFQIRNRIPRRQTVARVLVALFTNLAIFVFFSLVRLEHVPDLGSMWPRVIIDLAASQILLALIAPWFFALQKQMLALARYERDNLTEPA